MDEPLFIEARITHVKRCYGITQFRVDSKQFYISRGPDLQEGDTVRMLVQSDLRDYDDPASNVLAMQRLPAERIYYTGPECSLVLTLIGAVETALALHGITWMLVPAAVIMILQIRFSLEKIRALAMYRQWCSQTMSLREPQRRL
jgi:hypothetical protein